MNDKMRKEFEAWFLSVDHKPFGWFDHNGLERNAADDCYTDGYVQGCSIGYQAGREAVVVQMPDAHSYTAPDVAGAAILDCMTAIRKAGGKAKL